MTRLDKKFIFRDFAQERFGWKKQQIDEILKPVVR
jgi:hypothetical protein